MARKIKVGEGWCVANDKSAESATLNNGLKRCHGWWVERDGVGVDFEVEIM